jgi:hypothetical protein
MNAANRSNAIGGGTIGKKTDPAGIIGEVRKVCQNKPSLSLALAVNEVYERFEDEATKEYFKEKAMQK